MTLFRWTTGTTNSADDLYFSGLSGQALRYPANTEATDFFSTQLGARTDSHTPGLMTTTADDGSSIPAGAVTCKARAVVPDGENKRSTEGPTISEDTIAHSVQLQCLRELTAILYIITRPVGVTYLCVRACVTCKWAICVALWQGCVLYRIPGTVWGFCFACCYKPC